MKKLLLSLSFLSLSFLGNSQITLFGDTTNLFSTPKVYTPWRAYTMSGAIAIAYPSAMVGLNEIWYKNGAQTDFYWRNDNSHWMQLDKVGHFAAAYRISQVTSSMYTWSGVNFRKASLVCSIIGFTTVSSIEIFDGRSSKYGASWGDLAVNALGAGFLYYQSTWDDPYALNIKFTTSPSAYANYNSFLLGNSRIEQIFSDYNSQTYWVSFGMNKVIPFEGIPDWLNIAVGYGADGMIGERLNPQQDLLGNLNPDFDRYRQYYLSLDVELRKIKSKYPFVNAVFKNIGFLKIPFPTLEFSKYGVKPYWYYF